MICESLGRVPLFTARFIRVILENVGDLMNELARLELLIGDKVKQLAKKTVLIIGLGGVGGYAVEALARSGIGHLILVDGDIVEATNMNRQIIATKNTIGQLKTEAWKQRIGEIGTDTKVTCVSAFITAENIEQLFAFKPDYLIDACDTVATKKELIRKSVEYGIPLISCMGMGNKMDPSKIEVTEIRKTSYDPLARAIRQMVRKEQIKDDVMVVCSTEAPLQHGSEAIASNAIVPSVAGLLCANYVFHNIIS